MTGRPLVSLDDDDEGRHVIGDLRTGRPVAKVTPQGALAGDPRVQPSVAPTCILCGEGLGAFANLPDAVYAVTEHLHDRHPDARKWPKPDESEITP